MKKIFSFIFWILIATGFVLRLKMLPYNGIFDMAVYYEWGLNTLNSGLSEAFQGNYLPFQYQIFEFGALITRSLNVNYVLVFKILNLIFDCGNLFVLYLIFKKINVSKYYLLIYWIHPWFLIMFSQGYCDFHFTFFILCSILFSLKASAKNYLLTGLFLGFAFLMKPQAEVIVLSLVIYFLFQYFKDREIKTLHLFVFPAILFVNYSLYFMIESGNPFRLLKVLVDTGNSMPLTANFLNGWFPIAYYLKTPDSPIYSVGDEFGIPGMRFRTFAIFSLLIILGFFIFKIYRNKTQKYPDFNYLFLVTFSTFIFPFVMTSAHENHLFLATVLLIPVLGKIKHVLVKISIHALLIIQCINLYGFYGIGDNKYINMINISYNYEIAFVLSLISFIAFLIITISFVKPESKILNQMQLND